MTHRTRFSVSILIWLHVIVVVLEAAGTIVGVWFLFGTRRAQKAHP